MKVNLPFISPFSISFHFCFHFSLFAPFPSANPASCSSDSLSYSSATFWIKTTGATDGRISNNARYFFYKIPSVNHALKKFTALRGCCSTWSITHQLMMLMWQNIAVLFLDKMRLGKSISGEIYVLQQLKSHRLRKKKNNDWVKDDNVKKVNLNKTIYIIFLLLTMFKYRPVYPVNCIAETKMYWCWKVHPLVKIQNEGNVFKQKGTFNHQPVWSSCSILLEHKKLTTTKLHFYKKQVKLADFSLVLKEHFVRYDQNFCLKHQKMNWNHQQKKTTVLNSRVS